MTSIDMVLGAFIDAWKAGSAGTAPAECPVPEAIGALGQAR